MQRFLLLFVAGLVGWSPSSAAATTLVTPSGAVSPWQSRLEGLAVPTPVGVAIVADEPCPEVAESTWGCVQYDGLATPQIWISPDAPRSERRVTLYHKLGHLVGAALTPAQETAFATLAGDADPASAPTRWLTGAHSLSERFAVAYSVAARYDERAYRAIYPFPHTRRSARDREQLRDARRFRRVGLSWEAGWRATPARHRAFLRLLRVAKIERPWLFSA
jgi:hypothetical protein